MSRYVDDPNYRRSEPRHSSRRDTRERDHRERGDSTRDRRVMDDRIDRDARMSDVMDTRLDSRMDPRMDSRMDPRMDTRMDIRTDPRANTASRLNPRPDRTVDSRNVEPDGPGVLYRDPTTGELYREVRREVPSRSPYTGDEPDFEVPPSRSRTTMDPPMSRDRDGYRPGAPGLSEYFCPGEGIEREVIQHEICKYLGQDATCRPGRNAEGRSGYWVKAYRPFTTAMEQSLREDTIKWQRERERRTRSGRSQGSYADMQARQERERRYPGEMDLDDDDYRQPAPRHRDPRDPEPHPRDAPRPVASGGRVPVTAVTTGYPPEPTYPTGSYAISSTREGYAPGQPAYYGSEREPRTAFAGGASTPPSINRSGQSGAYVQPGGYPSRTGPPVSAPISTSYDPRRDMMGAYPSGYSDSRSHRR
ncbi:hypothetical protein, variant [Exophiala xenobiotica]|uniref:Uncharacterized protein n=1 Tax=Exophiala xenobiotica TaxID=348802 RepID=A0A0D2BWV4_9EURO|nr:hypothetical protein, variant [Exophiala xenobiotica]KIW56916.1 hypothetical protein, variant [Exophiala xenobiotica]